MQNILHEITDDETARWACVSTIFHLYEYNSVNGDKQTGKSIGRQAMTDMLTSKHIGWATCMRWLVVDWAVLDKCGGGGGVRLCVCVLAYTRGGIFTRIWHPTSHWFRDGWLTVLRDTWKCATTILGRCVGSQLSVAGRAIGMVASGVYGWGEHYVYAMCNSNSEYTECME